jgi:hypothetical protein
MHRSREGHCRGIVDGSLNYSEAPCRSVATPHPRCCKSRRGWILAGRSRRDRLRHVLWLISEKKRSLREILGKKQPGAVASRGPINRVDDQGREPLVEAGKCDVPWRHARASSATDSVWQ